MDLVKQESHYSSTSHFWPPLSPDPSFYFIVQSKRAWGRPKYNVGRPTTDHRLIIGSKEGHQVCLTEAFTTSRVDVGYTTVFRPINEFEDEAEQTIEESCSHRTQRCDLCTDVDLHGLNFLAPLCAHSSLPLARLAWWYFSRRPLGPPMPQRKTFCTWKTPIKLGESLAFYEVFFCETFAVSRHWRKL